MSGFRFFSKKKPPGNKIREARFAGSWYESDKLRLNEQLEEYLQSANGALSRRSAHIQFQDPPEINQLSADKDLLAVVSPHAGYMFSGQTAAYAFARASKDNEKHPTKRVILLGPSHYTGFEGAALTDAAAFETPLGNLPVDSTTVESLADFPLFRYMPEVHRKEHSLELQLPLIYKTFGAVEIVPIVIGQLEDEMETRLIAGVLKRFLKEGDIVVVSSDFCHIGPRYQYQPFEDNLKENVYQLDREAFTYINALDVEGFYQFRQRTGATICGFYPICVLMSILPEDAGGSVLNYATSQDSLVEDDDNSVSYMAIGLGVPTSEKLHWHNEEVAEGEVSHLSHEERLALLAVARKSIESATNKLIAPPNVSDLKKTHRIFCEPRGVFVTLFKKNSASTKERELRGCIGHIWPVRSLVDAVCENAMGAAMRDYRFLPVTSDELDDLEIEISVLSPLKRIDSYDEIVVGRDGVVFYKNGSQAVFLPHVAEQFGWDREQMLTQLSLKAGQGESSWREGAKFDIFQTESFEEGESHS